MQLECKKCQQILNLPDARLPLGRPFAFTCPHCQHKNTALIPAPEGQASPPPGGDPEPKAAPKPPAKPLDRLSAFSEAADDRPRSIVVFDDPEVQNMLVQKLEANGYNASAALSLRDAAKQLKFADSSLLILQENYSGSTLNGNLLLRTIQNIDLGSRRGMLIVLVSPTMTSLDDLAAFGLSIDAVINTAELECLDQFLVSITARAKKFYATYQEMLAEHGLG